MQKQKRKETEIGEIINYNNEIKGKSIFVRSEIDDLIIRLNKLKPQLKQLNEELANNKIASKYDEIHRQLINTIKKKRMFLKQLINYSKDKTIYFEYNWNQTKRKLTIACIKKENQKVLHISHIKTFDIAKISTTKEQAKHLISFLPNGIEKTKTYEYIKNSTYLK